MTPRSHNRLQMLEGIASALNSGMAKMRQTPGLPKVKNDQWSVYMLQKMVEKLKEEPQALHDPQTLFVLQQLLQAVHAIPKLEGEKGDRGEIGPKGDRGEQGESIVGPRGPQGERGEPGIGLVGPQGPEGRDGRDGVANPAEVLDLAERVVGTHEKRFDHALLHDPKILGTKEVDEGTIGTDRYLKFNGSKLVYAEMPTEKGQRVFYGGGGSSLSDYFKLTRTVTASTTIQPEDRIVHVDATSGNITLTLHTASGHDRRSHFLKRIDATANTVTISPTGSETIEFTTTDQLPNQGSSRMYYADSGSWYLMHA